MSPVPRLWPQVCEWFESAIGHAAPRGWDRRIIFGLTEFCGPLPLSPSEAIIFNAEQIASPGNPYWRRAAEYASYTWWDFSHAGAAELRRRGLRAIHCPIGFDPAMIRVPADREDADVLFYGALNDRRKRLLAAIDAQGLNVRALENCYGPALDAEIARARVVLNCHYYEGAEHEIFRTVPLFANRKCCVSEPGGDALAGEAAVCAPIENIPAVCRLLARDSAMREWAAMRGETAIRRRLLSDSVAAAIDQTLRLGQGVA